MLICHCRQVNDQRIRQAASSGASTVAQVARVTDGAGACCGGCVPAIAEILEKARPLPVVPLGSVDLDRVNVPFETAGSEPIAAE